MTEFPSARTLLLGRPSGMPPIPRHLVILSIVAIILSGALGFGITRLIQIVNAHAEIKIMDHTSHRPTLPPLPDSPFR